jgi:2-isopropylmalate synthase
LLDYTALVSKQGGVAPRTQAMVRLRVGDQIMHTAADAEGPVHAMDQAIRKALIPYYPILSEVHLVDFKVRIIDTHMGSAAKPRVLIETGRGDERWSTVGCSDNIIEASWQALWDSLELPLVRERDAAASDSGNGRTTAQSLQQEPILTSVEA